VCLKSWARRSVCLCMQSGGGAIIGLTMYRMQSCDCGRRTVRFMRLTLTVVVKNDEEFVNVMVLLFLFSCSIFNALVNKAEFIPYCIR
jgi:hypothetical protein